MLDSKRRVAGLIIPRLDGNRIQEDDYFKQVAVLVDAGIGGFILFGGKTPETSDALKRLQDRAETPLLITSDIERGLGQQMTGGTRFPNQWAVAEAIDRRDSDDVRLLHRMLEVAREECLAAGIHVVFSPVADVNVNPDNPIICIRSFGEEPDMVSWFTAEYIKGLQKGFSTHPSSLTPHPFLLACAKHFPGHGDTAVDSHTSLPVINADLARLERVELPPFVAAIEAGVAVIMIGHLQVPALEPEPIPATFSKRIVTRLLRERMGFNGLIVTDALDMGALKSICDEGEAGVRCLQAGCDILLHPSEPLKMLDSVVKAVEDGRLPEERVVEAYKRVMNIKNKWPVSGGQWPEIGSQQSRNIAYEIAGKAVKFRKGRGIAPTENIACLVIDDDGDGSVARPFLDAMTNRLTVAKIVSSPLDINRDETIVVPIFSRVGAWKGSSGLSNASLDKVRGALGRAGRAVLISFGSPYILKNIDADVIVNAFDPADCMQRVVVDRLFA